MAKCSPANLCLHLTLSHKSKEWLTLKNSTCNHTLFSLEPTKSKVPVAYGRNSVRDLARSNDVATNGVNGNKTWYKCECCAPVGTSIGVSCLEITETCKRRFSSRFSSCLNICRSDPHFVLWYSRQENFIIYLISIQCWSLVNQNKSFLSLETLWLLVFCKTFYFINRIFFFIRDVFWEHIFSKEHPIGFRGSVVTVFLKNNILSSDSPKVAIHRRCSRTF